MNKLLYFIAISFMSICLCSCSVEKSKNDLNDNYRIVESIYTDNNETANQFVDIKYPQICGLGNNHVEQSINDQIKTTALEVLDEFTTLDEMEISVKYSLDISSPSYLSLHFIRKSFHSAQAYPLIRIIALNFDIDSGEKIILKDVISIDDNFVKSFFHNFQLQGSYESLDEKNIINKYVSEVISIEKFYACDEDLFSDCQSYFTDNSLFISIAVPYSAGSYAVYEAKFTDINELLNDKLIDGK
ncbi:hypothetical protein [Lacrimispora sp.]|uniref:hypothetical protein n=1 Tax=Lacrimispora sp. TaxID=2719234 RepID=UPI0028A82546|nr:hypothetical protein [Lacrimispora sp.]